MEKIPLSVQNTEKRGKNSTHSLTRLGCHPSAGEDQMTHLKSGLFACTRGCFALLDGLYPYGRCPRLARDKVGHE